MGWCVWLLIKGWWLSPLAAMFSVPILLVSNVIIVQVLYNSITQPSLLAIIYVFLKIYIFLQSQLESYGFQKYINSWIRLLFSKS